jgi:hypothetical protein
MDTVHFFFVRLTLNITARTMATPKTAAKRSGGAKKSANKRPVAKKSGGKRSAPKKSGEGPRLNVGSRLQVWNGTAKKTGGGLTKADLKLKKGSGGNRIVSKKKSEAMIKKGSEWMDAVETARRELKITGFVTLNRGEKGIELYKWAKDIYDFERGIDVPTYKAPKKSGAKSPAPKKSGAKKSGTKKSGAKKSGAKKSGAKKSGAKKSGGERRQQPARSAKK